MYCMRQYECFSRPTCHHCKILKQHFLPWETLVDPHCCCGWINTEMTSQWIFYSSLSLNPPAPRSPGICPTSPSPSLSLFLTYNLFVIHAVACNFVFYQTLDYNACENMATKGWWETEGACCLLWLLWLSSCFFVKMRQVSFSLETETINKVVCTTRVMDCFDGKQTTS